MKSFPKKVLSDMSKSLVEEGMSKSEALIVEFSS